MDDTRSKHGQSSADSIPEPPPPTRQYQEPQPQQPPTGYPPPPPPPPPPPHQEQEPAIGYPPAMGYPPGYQHYQQPPPGMYYPPPHYRRQGEPSASRVFLTMTLLIFFTFTFGIIVWLVVRPGFPIFYVESFIVSNFDVARDNFTSAWEANLVIENKNLGAKVHIDRLQSFIFYNSEDLLVSSYLETPLRDVTVQSYGKEYVHIKLSTSDLKQPVPPPDKRVVDEMRKQRRTGTVAFSLKAFAWAKVQSGLITEHSKFLQIRILCEDLKVQFEGNSGNGKLSGRSKDCGVEL